MNKYNSWINTNLYNPNKRYYKYWADDFTYVTGVYDSISGKGIEQIYKLKDEYEIDKKNELLEDLENYQE